MSLSAFLRDIGGANETLRAAPDADNAWLLLARQATAAFANRLDEHRYRYPRGLLVDATLDAVAPWLLEHGRAGAGTIPFVGRQGPTGALFLGYARALASYNELPSDKYDLAHYSCKLGGHDNWDARALDPNGDAPQGLQIATIVLGVAGMGLGLAVTLYHTAMCIQRKRIATNADFEPLESEFANSGTDTGFA